MSDDADFVDDEADGLAPEITALLGRADTWDELPADLEDRVMAAIDAERAASAAGADGAPSTFAAPAIDLAAAREQRDERTARRASRRALPQWLAAAAVVAVVAAGVLFMTRGGGDDDGGGVEFALAGTELAPDASATAIFESTPAGLKIVLDATGLPGAGPNEMYEAWISDGTIRVPIGTFHLRGGDAPIALWAGTDDPRFNTITVTREPIDGVAESSGEVVLRGEFQLP